MKQSDLQRGLRIENGSLEEAFALSLRIPEFEPWYPLEKWEQRLNGRNAVILIAFLDNIPAGFKVGYQDQEDFYSWVGGVLPNFRRKGLAIALAVAQEEAVRESGITRIRMKTRNRFKGMLHFALQRSFYIAEVEQRGEPQDWRITLHKNI